MFLLAVGSKEAGIAAFKKQFKSKSANDWDKRANFKAKSGKYTLIEIEHGEEEEVEEIEKALAKIEGPIKQRTSAQLSCSLPAATQALIRLPKVTFSNAVNQGNRLGA